MSKIIRTKLRCSTIDTVFILLFLSKRQYFYYFLEETISSDLLKKISDGYFIFQRKVVPNNDWYEERILCTEKC